MPKLFLVKTPSGFLPLDDEDKAITNKFGEGEICEVEIRKARNWKNHKRFFAMVKLIFENQDKYQTIGELLIELKLIAGHYDVHVTNKGEPIYIPKSISFEKMDEVEFQTFFDHVIDAALSKKLISTTKEEFIEELQLRIMDFT